MNSITKSSTKSYNLPTINSGLRTTTAKQTVKSTKPTSSALFSVSKKTVKNNNSENNAKLVEEASEEEETTSEFHVFFTEDILKQYSIHYLNNEPIVMLSIKDLMDRLPIETTFNERVKFMVSYINNACSGNIKIPYISYTLRKVLDEYYNQEEEQDRTFDFITFENPNSNDSLSFILTEKGGCKKFSDMNVLSLICSKKNAGRIAFQLYIFTVLYKYAIKNQQHVVGLLELLYGYVNISGFCLYSKYGFNENGDLFSKNEEYCFDDLTNLPMIFEPRKHIEKYKKEHNVDSVSDVEGIKNVITYITNQEKVTNCKIRNNNNNNVVKLQNYYNVLSNLYLILKTGLEKEFTYIYDIYDVCIDNPIVISYTVIFDKLIKDLLSPSEKNNLENSDMNSLSFVRSEFTKEQLINLFTNIKNVIFSKMNIMKNCIETNNTHCLNQTVEEYNLFLEKSEKCNV